MVRSGRNVQGILIVGLMILLLVAIGYILFGFFTNWQQQNELGTFQQGAQYGYQQAILQVAQSATTCQQVPLSVGNQTIEVVWVGCLQQ